MHKLEQCRNQEHHFVDVFRLFKGPKYDEIIAWCSVCGAIKREVTEHEGITSNIKIPQAVQPGHPNNYGLEVDFSYREKIEEYFPSIGFMSFGGAESTINWLLNQIREKYKIIIEKAK